jgi:surfeit locus 1 family protein
VASSYRFALRPRWLVLHAVAIGTMVLFVALGFWQLRRLDERNELDRRITERMAEPPAPLDDLLAASDPAAIELRRTVASGTYMAEDEIVLRSQSLDGLSGHHVLMPLLTDDGYAVIVDRGWVPIDDDTPPVAGAEAPSGDVRVDGIVQLTQVRGRFGPVDPATGDLTQIARIDLARIGSQLSYPLAAVWIQLTGQEPAQTGELPVVVPEPEPGGGAPHLSYAVQWFTFALIGAIGYPLVLARIGRGHGSVGG